MRDWICNLAGLAAMVFGSPLSALNVDTIEHQDVTTIVFPMGRVSVTLDQKSNSLIFADSGADPMQINRPEFESSRFMWVEHNDASPLTAQLLCDCIVRVKTGQNATSVSIMNAASRAVNYGELRFVSNFTDRGYGAISGPFHFRRTSVAMDTASTASGKRTVSLPIELPMSYDSQTTGIVAQRMLGNLGSDGPGYDVAKFLESSSMQDNSSQIVVRGDILQQSRAMPEVEEGAAALVSGCADFRRTSPQEWPATHTALSLIAETRNTIGQENGGLDVSAAAHMVVGYLSLGMGAEASQYIAIANFSNTETPIFKAISRAIDGQESEFGFATGQVDICPSAAIWAVLGGSASEKSILGLARVQFAQAPSGVQSAIGSRLAARFLEGNDRDAAAFVLKTIEGLPEQQTGERGLVVGQLEKKEGYTARSVKVLKDITRKDADVAPNALLGIVKNALEEGESIGDHNEQLLNTYRSERQGTDLEKDLLRAELQARTNRGDYSDVIGMLPDFERIARPSQVDLAIDDLADAVLKDSSDAVFLTAIMDLPKAYLRRVSESQRQDINQRFTSLGLEGLARELWNENYNPDVTAHSNGEAAKPMDTPRIDAPQMPQIVDTQKSNTGNQIASNAARRQPVETSTSRGVVRKEQRLAPVQKPLAEAVDRSGAVLDTLTELKAEIADLGLK